MSKSCFSTSTVAPGGLRLRAGTFRGRQILRYLQSGLIKTFAPGGNPTVTKKLSIAIASSVLVALLGLQLAAPAFAASKVDCDAVMSELNGGKKVAEVAKDLKISRSSVYRCRKKAKAAAASAPAAMAAPAAPEAPAAAASPAAK